MENKLPASFEAFAEARKNGFIKAKKVKDEGGKIAGTFCTFAPLEVLDAAGVYSVILCGMSDETIPDAEVDLPKNLCPLIKSSYGFAVSDKCPYTYFSDILIGETTCDGKKKMYELLNEIKEMYVMQIPQGIDRSYALDMWRNEMRLFIKAMEERFQVEITDEKLRDAADYRNRLRKAKCKLMELQKLDPPPMGGFELYKFLESTGFQFDWEGIITTINEYIEKIEGEYQAGRRREYQGRKRILVTGCPAGGIIEKLTKAVEENGGVVVCFENCGGIKPMRLQVDTQAEHIADAIADQYMDIGCSVMSPNLRRMEMLPALLEEFKVDGVIDIALQACHPYRVEQRNIKALCDELNMPYMASETDYSQTDTGQINTRIAAFIEML